MNLEVIRPSRKILMSGDVFVFKLKQQPGQFWFGRIIRTDSSVGIFKNTILIYLFDFHSAQKTCVPALTTDHLLVPPIHTNKLPWTKGFFEVVTNRQINANEILPQHTFKSFSRGTFFDEYSNPVANPVEPIGGFALHSYKTIDDAISKALGIPLFEE